jgi:predicted dehydrogenase
MTKDNVSRRSFLKTGAVVAAASATVAAPATVSGANLNGKLRVAFVGVGGRCRAHIRNVCNMQNDGLAIEAAAVCDVYKMNIERAVGQVEKAVKTKPVTFGDYREVIDSDKYDIVCTATPDHWHAKITIDALDAGQHVYCEKPMTHTIQESQDVVAAWKKSGKIMQVGVQGTADGRWKAANQFLREGHAGKVVQAQTHYYRNSDMGQWRYYGLSKDMTPKNVDWKMFLGTEFGLAPEMPFDRGVFGQWRRFWPFGCGLYTDLFVHRLTQILTALGVRYPRRVAGGGGIFLEYDSRDVPDTATIIADYDEGLQVVISATMCCQDRPLEVCVRGHHGTVVFPYKLPKGFPSDARKWMIAGWPYGEWGNDGFDFFPERPQVTKTSKPKPMHVSAAAPEDETRAHWENFLEAIEKNDQQACNNPPDLGAAAVTTVTMGAESYRFGKVFEWDSEAGKAVQSNAAYAAGWEAMSKERSAPNHIPGWDPYNKDPMFSRQVPKDYQSLEGPWRDDNTDPAGE